MRVERVAEGIWRIPTIPRAINAFLVAGPSGLTLIDPGMSFTFRRLARGIEATGHSPSAVRTVVATHAHIDHAGALAKLKALSGARVLAGAADAVYIARGDAPPLDQTLRGVGLLSRSPDGYPACAVDEGVRDGDLIDGLRVIDTPGHTPGHIALLHQDTGVLFTGDAVINPMNVRPPFAWFCTSLEQMRASIARLADLDFATAGFAHGMPIRGTARDAIAALAARARG